MAPHFGFVAVRAGDHGENSVDAGRRAGVVVQRRRNRDFRPVGVRAGDVDDFAAVFTGHAADFGGGVVERIAVDHHRRDDAVAATGDMFLPLAGIAVAAA